MNRLISFGARLVLTFILLQIGFLATQLVYLNVMPISWWVKYDGLRITDRADTGELAVEVERDVRTRIGVITLSRFVEMHEKLPDGTILQHCPSATFTTAETTTNRTVRTTLADFMGPDCSLGRLTGRSVFLQAVYSMALPYGLSKQRAFYVGPFTVTPDNHRSEIGSEGIQDQALAPIPTGGE